MCGLPKREMLIVSLKVGVKTVSILSRESQRSERI